MSRKEKRKELKKLKRKQLRRESASVSAQEEVEEHAEEEEEALAKERADHEEQERLWLLREEEAHKEWLRKQEEEIKRKKEDERTCKDKDGEELEEGWKYVEDGPAEIIWQGNEIIVKKPRKKVKKGTNSDMLAIEDKDRPTSNPLPPQSTAFSSYQANAQDLTDLNTNFGTEQDKRNCPFYIKTGVCRFGVRCSRLHPVFNEACTLLMRSMYTGTGLVLEHVESLEYTDEEVAQEYEEFYDDVHSEFIQFGELVNFKVCRNGSPHLRGNVYVHYASQESAMLAYNHMNGRFYAKKQISCEFVGVKKWKIAICGEFMRTNYKTCSHGSACNFMHCFENPRREYEWADLDRPPPRFWQRKMAKLFGHAYISDEDSDEKQEKVRSHRESTYSNHMVRHRGDRVSTYDDDRRKDRHMKESVREYEHRRRSDGREQKYCEDETKDRISRESKYDDRRRVKHSRDNNHGTPRRDKDIRDSTHHDDSARDKSTSRSMYDDDDDDDAYDDERYFRGHKKIERWSPGSHGETDGREAVYSKDQRRGHKGASYDYEDNDIGDARHVARNSTTSDAAYHSHSHHSERHRSRRRSRSPESHKSRRSRSRDRSMSHSARGEDGYYSVDEHQHRYSKAIRDKERSSKESKQHRQHSSTQSSNYAFGNQEASQTLEGRVDEDVNRYRKRHSSQDRRKYSESEHDQSLTTQESDHTRIRHSKDLVCTIAAPTTDEYTSGNLRKLERQSGLEVGIDVASQNQETDGNSSGDTVTGLSLVLTTDDVQKSTSQWQSWRKAKAKKVKFGIKDHPPRLVI